MANLIIRLSSSVEENLQKLPGKPSDGIKNKAKKNWKSGGRRRAGPSLKEISRNPIDRNKSEGANNWGIKASDEKQGKRNHIEEANKQKWNKSKTKDSAFPKIALAKDVLSSLYFRLYI